MSTKHENNPLDETTHFAATKAWISVVRAYNECNTTLTRYLKPLGLSVLQHEILMNLQETPGLTQQHLAKRCFSAKSGMSKLVAGFEKDGVILRTKSASDSRAWNLYLTDKGTMLARDAQKIQHRVVSRMASNYSLDELRHLNMRMDESSEQLQAMRSGDDT